MQVLFKSRDAEAQQLRELAVSRVRFVMRRLGWLVPLARVQLADVNGPRGGVDKRCQIELKTEQGRTVVVTATAQDWRTALDDALSRAARMLLRAGRRQRTQSQPGRRAFLDAP